MTQGVTLTCPGFYAPQGRTTRVPAAVPGLLQKLSGFCKDGFRLANLEMETAGYYGLGEIFGHEMLSLNAVVANRLENVFAENPEKIVDGLIELTLDGL